MASQNTVQQSVQITGRGVGLSLTLLGLLSVVGCSESPPITKNGAAAELSVGIPAGGSDPGALSDGRIAAPRLRDLNGDNETHLTAFAAQRDGKSRYQWKLNRLKQAIQPPQLNDQSGRLVQQGSRPPIELVPTPRPAIDAEVVATPKGVPNGATTEAAEVATGPVDYATWPKPAVTLVVTGQQHGYIEPCGCTGLDNQKGGVARRLTFLNQLRQLGWELIPIDAGNQVRRIGQQASIKFSWSSESLKRMNYEAVGFGPDDLRLSAIDLVQVAAAENADDAMYVSANLVIIDPSFMPTQKVIERGGMKIGVTSILDPESLDSPPAVDFTIKPPIESARAALEAMNEMGATFRVLSFFGTDDKSEEAAKATRTRCSRFRSDHCCRWLR